ncbi:MAG: hypothetical protein M1832_001973 [Thelocarpon impressellum]|nr:MAG: hypothetical protein M1832_001973 [Thelocarpon impressellum]
MGVEPPFLYDPPSRNSGAYANFDPKSFTRASLDKPLPRIKSEGPLLSFNQHPDSYLILPYGNTKARPMSRRTKGKVKWTRLLQLALRVLELAAAVGILIAAVCVRGVDEVNGWIIRATVPPLNPLDYAWANNDIKPGVAVFHTIYAIYHLSRRASGRTPTSSASYMLFAAAADTSLLPFYVFTALLANRSPEGWHTVFTDPAADDKVVRALAVMAVSAASLHLVSLVLSLYLAVVFRQIGRLPPDMNPLEANLTSRSAARHKKRDSYVTEDEKRASKATLSSDSSSPRSSRAQNPMRAVPFLHTRTDSRESLSSSNARSTLPSQLPSSPPRSSLARGTPPRSPPKQYQRIAHPTAAAITPAPSSPAKSRSALLSDNWFTYEDHEPTPLSPKRSGPRASDASTVSSMRSSELRLSAFYEPLPQVYDDVDIDDVSTPPRLHPLEANPPTPPPPSSVSQQQPGLRLGSLNRAGPGSLKAKLYGDLKAATPPLMVGEWRPTPVEKDVPPAVGSRRVVSRTSGLQVESTARGNGERRREVSGKVVEEGRAGTGEAGLWGQWRRED